MWVTGHEQAISESARRDPYKDADRAPTRWVGQTRCSIKFESVIVTLDRDVRPVFYFAQTSISADVLEYNPAQGAASCAEKLLITVNIEICLIPAITTLRNLSNERDVACSNGRGRGFISHAALGNAVVERFLRPYKADCSGISRCPLDDSRIIWR